MLSAKNPDGSTLLVRHVLASLAVAGLLAAAPAAQEAVTNGGFDNALDGWTVTLLGNPFQPGAVGSVDIDGAGPLPPGAAFEAQVSGFLPPFSPGLVRLTQDVSLTAGQTYAFSTDIAMVSPGFVEPDMGTIQVRVGRQSLDARHFTVPTGWEYGTLSALFSVPASGRCTLVIDLIREGSLADLTPLHYLDNVSILPTGGNPPPSPAAGPALPAGDLFVSSFASAEVLRFNGDSGALIGVAAAGGGLSGPVGLTLAPSGALLVCSSATDEVLRFAPANGVPLGLFASLPLDTPQVPRFGPNGNLYVSESGGMVQFDGVTGDYVSSVHGLTSARDFAFGPGGDLYVADEAADAVLRFEGLNGEPLGVFTTGTSFESPEGVLFGPDGHLYVACLQGTERVLRFHGVTGDFLGVAAVGGLGHAGGLTFSPANTLLVCDAPNDEVVEFDADTALSLGVFASDGLSGPALGLGFFAPPVTPWIDLGGGTPGLALPPLLFMSGPLTPSSLVELNLVDAAPSALAFVFLSFTSTPMPFLGGNLHAFPFDELFIVGTNPGGEIHGSADFPGAAAGQSLWFQVGIVDASVPIYGASLSNAMQGTVP